LILTHPSETSIAKTSLEYTLSQRMSIRNWSDTPIEYEIMKTICKNSFASAFDLEGMELHISNSTGTYQYDKEHNQFVSKISADVRYQLGLDIGQRFVANAPYIITLIYNDEIEPSPLDANRKGGIIIQNLYILAIRHNLGGVCVGDRIYDEVVATNIQNHLGLTENLKPILLFPIGYLTAGQSYPTGNLQATTGNLPTPLESAMDVMELLQKSHKPSTTWENTDVTPQKLSNMLWAAYGYSLLGTGHRTVPSAYGEYPFQIYVFNKTGVYNYTAESHSLDKTSSVDKRSNIIKHANAPEYLEKAPALLLFCWNSKVGTHNASDSDSGGRFINIGYGCCLQNLYLSATAWNISISSPFHTYNYDALRTDLSDTPLPNIYPMYLIGIGETYEDEEPPIIGTPIRTPTDEVLPNQKVKIEVNVTDAKSGIENVTLSYTTDNGTSWINIPMSYNTTTGYYEALIPEQPNGTIVKYEITAFDKANNKSVENNSGQYYYYTVIPEITATMFLLILVLSTTFIFMAEKLKTRKNPLTTAP
jgi:nitroreductase